jgi:hypothetical protein
MRHLRFAQARSVVFKRQLFLRFVNAKAAQAVGVRELAEMAQLVFGERRLQFVGDVNESHAGIIAARGKPPACRPGGA